jgi:predicted transposase/invertase (TIGR01784 family)
MVFNTAKAYVKQLGSGENYNLLQTVYGLGILNDVFDEKTTEFYHHYRTVNCQNTEKIIKDVEIVLVELPKFKPEKWADRKMAVLWLRFLKEVKENQTVVPEEFKENADIRKALDICKESAFTKAELAAYDKYWDIVRTEIAALETSRAEGRAEGEAKGKAESLTNVVLNCKRNGFSLAQIQAVTGLEEERIKEILRSTIKN